MSTQPAIRSSKHPLGGISRDWRRRFLRFHVPLALASAVVLVLFMSLSPFDPLAYARVDMGSSGAFPQKASTSPMDTMDHGSGETDPMEESANQSADHGGGQTARDHGEGQTGSIEESANQSADHGGDQTGSMEEMDDPGGDRAAFTVGGLTVIQDRFTLARLTDATGYVALGFLALTLLIGPANLLLRKRNPVSSYLRRDVGTWTAIFSVVHVVFGLELHSDGQLSNMFRYFVVDGSPLTNSFGWGNWTGLAALVIVAGLLALSNDFTLRKLKAKRWKRLQRLNYALFALVIAHAFFYGALLRLDSPFTRLLGLSVFAVVVGQAVGIRLWRQRFARAAVSQPA